MYQQLTSPDCILRVSDGALIPIDPDNTDYQNVLSWLGEGNELLPPPELPPPPPPPPPGPSVEMLAAELEVLKAKVNATAARVDAVEDAVLPLWQQPINAETAYPVGAKVRHESPNRPGLSIWESLIPANTQEPGLDGMAPDGPWMDRWWKPLR